MSISTIEMRKIVAGSSMTDEQKAALGIQLATGPAPVVAPKAAPEESPLSEKFLAIWHHLRGPELKPEFEFSGRKFRFDFCHFLSMVAIELEGGGYSGKGRHFTPEGFKRDCIKYNLATAMGYRVFRLTGALITVENVAPIVTLCRIYDKPVTPNDERLFTGAKL